MKKIDIHCHILPGLDDGAAIESESLRLIQMALRQNITTLIATPHYSEVFKNDRPDEIRRMCAKLEKKASDRFHADISIYPGQEIFYTEDVPEKLKRKELLTLADSAYVLIEYLPNTPYSTIYRSVRDLSDAQYKPVLAHIERYSALRTRGRVEELIEEGAYMQMNYRRIGGKWYDETTRWCRRMLKEEKISFLGTDMHNVRDRKPKTGEAEVWMKKRLDNQYMKAVVYSNAQKILTGH